MPDQTKATQEANDSQSLNQTLAPQLTPKLDASQPGPSVSPSKPVPVAVAQAPKAKATDYVKVTPIENGLNGRLFDGKCTLCGWHTEQPTKGGAADGTATHVRGSHQIQ